MTDQNFVISVNLKPLNAQAATSLRVALDSLRKADPTIGFEIEHAEEVALRGQNDLQLETALDRIRGEFKIDVATSDLQIAYRETIARQIEWECTRKLHHFGFARVRIRFEPGRRDSGLVFENATATEVVPEIFVSGVEKGLKAASKEGILAGFPVTDLKCTLIDGGYDEIESSVMTFDVATRACLQEALPKAGPRLLEPIMEVGVATPDEYMGEVIGDLNSRRGQVTGMKDQDKTRLITALVPLPQLFRYHAKLNEITRGTATHTMTFRHYEQVPPSMPGGDDNFPMAAALRA